MKLSPLVKRLSGANKGLDQALEAIAQECEEEWEEGDMGAVVCGDAIVLAMVEKGAFRVIVCAGEPTIRPDIITGFIEREE